MEDEERRIDCNHFLVYSEKNCAKITRLRRKQKEKRKIRGDKLKLKTIKKRKYYWHRDSSSKGFHPFSYVYKKNDKKNKYNIVCFTSSNGKGRKKLNIDPNSNQKCYILNNPQSVKRKSFSTELVGNQIRK